MPSHRIFVLLGIAALLATAQLSRDSSASASHAWANFHWAHSANPVTLTLVNRMTTNDWKNHFATSAADWDAGGVLDIVTTTGGKGCKAVSGKIVVCNGRFGFNGWLGLAQIWASGDHIVQGVSKMNDSYFNTSTYNNQNARLHVLCQEVGHAFGLDHQHGAASNTCMDDVNGLFDPAFTHPNQHDFDELGTIYAHLDSNSTLNASQSGAVQVGRDALPAAADDDDDEDWGRPVAFAPDGRPYLYEKGLGGEAKRYTFVYWAPRGNPSRWGGD